jgi:diguanylate cyclase (GGDEF)-like protein/PAS domain S-box-containing protein
MKIKTKLQMIIISTLVAVTLIVLLNRHWQQREGQLQTEEDSVNELHLAIFEMGQVRDEYFIYGEERAAMQWYFMHERIVRTLEKMSWKLTGTQEKDALNNIVKFHAASTGLFNRLVRLEEGREEGRKVDVARIRELKERIISQVLVNSHAQYLEALTLRKLVREKREYQRNRVHLYSNIAFGVLGLLIVFFAVTILLRVTDPLTRLHRGTEMIARGNLDYKTGIRTADEIGRLSTAFDVMTANLKEITVSRDELNREIEDRKRLEKQLQVSEERFRIASRSATDVIWDWDIRQGKIDWFGDIDQMLGYDPGEFPRTIEAWEKAIHPDDHDRVMAVLQQHLKMRTPYRAEYRVMRKNGEVCYWIARGAVQCDENGNACRMVGASNDITELHRYQEDLEYFAVHDTLTGLLNRRSLEDMLNRTIARAKRGTVSSLLYMDLDNFKNVNDTVGHAAGDEVLITLTGLLKAELRTEDVVFRLGGDEFAILLDGIDGREALPAAERLRLTVEAHVFEQGGRVFPLSLSIGLIEIEGDRPTGALLSHADTAMYKAKTQGKNRVVQATHCG